MSSVSKSKPHVVVVPLPIQGHLPPILHLSRKLAELGCVVTIVNIAYVHEKLKTSWNPPPELDIRFEALHSMETPQGPLEAFNQDYVGFFTTIHKLHDEFKLVMQKLLNMQGSPPVSCVLSDHFTGAWPFTVATDFNIPHATFFVPSATFLCLEYHARMLVSSGDIVNKDERDEHRLISYVPGVKSLKQTCLPYSPLEIAGEPEENDPHEKLMSMYHRSDRLRKTSRILCNTFYELEPNVVDALKEILGSKFLPISPLPSFNLEFVSQLSSIKEDSECLGWLDKQEPKSVIYVSYGSTTKISQTQFEEFIEGLESSRVKFLLVIRSGMVEGDLHQDFLSNFIERTSKRGLVIPWSPQQQVLKHEAIAAFFTHCGWNSVMESARLNGVPLVCWPWSYDHFINCHIAVEECKIGVELKRDRDGLVRRQEVEMVIRNACCGDEGKVLRENAERISAEAKTASAAAASNLLLFVQEIASK